MRFRKRLGRVWNAWGGRHWEATSAQLGAGPCSSRGNPGRRRPRCRSAAPGGHPEDTGAVCVHSAMCARLRRLRRGCGQELREVDKNSWPCSYHVDAFAFCMAVPDSALSRAEQSVERSLSGSAPKPRGVAACARGPPWPVPSMSCMHVVSMRAPGLAQCQLGARVPAPAEPSASAANPATLCPPGTAERHLGRRRPGLPRGEHGPAPSYSDAAPQR